MGDQPTLSEAQLAMASRGELRLGGACPAEEWHGMAGQGLHRYGSVGPANAGHGMASTFIAPGFGPGATEWEAATSPKGA